MDAANRRNTALRLWLILSLDQRRYGEDSTYIQ